MAINYDRHVRRINDLETKYEDAVDVFWGQLRPILEAQETGSTKYWTYKEAYTVKDQGAELLRVILRSVRDSETLYRAIPVAVLKSKNPVAETLKIKAELGKILRSNREMKILEEMQRLQRELDTLRPS